MGRLPSTVGPKDPHLLEFILSWNSLSPIAHKELNPAINHMRKFGNRLFPSQA